MSQQGERRARRARAHQGHSQSDDTIKLDLADCFVDVVEIEHAIQQGIGMLDPERLRALSALFAGDFWKDWRLRAARRSAPG